MFIEWKLVISDNKNFLYNGCIHTMQYYTCFQYYM